MDEIRVDTDERRAGRRPPARERDGDILIGIEGAAAVVTLDRPQALNALTDAMRARLAAAVPRWDRDPQVYAAADRLSSERAFCAGGDVREMARLGPAAPGRGAPLAG